MDVRSSCDPGVCSPEGQSPNDIMRTRPSTDAAEITHGKWRPHAARGPLRHVGRIGGRHFRQHIEDVAHDRHVGNPYLRVLCEAAPQHATNSVGTVPGRLVQSGSLRSTFARVSADESPPNARVPVNASNITHPSAQMSVRLSTGCPVACSGLM